MPSKITPKDFERFLPEERDTIAQGLLKYIRFAILFWRWYRNSHNSDGSLSYIFKDSTCRSGCLGSKGVVEGEPDGGSSGTVNEDGTGEASDDSRDQNNPNPVPHEPPVPPGPDTPGASGCCEPTVKDYSDFHFWETVKHVDLKCKNYTKSVAVKTGSPYGIDFDTGGAGSTFNNTVGWGNWSGSTSTGTDSSLISVSEQGGYDQAQGGTIGKNVWTNVSIFIYGKTPQLWSIGSDDKDTKGRRPDIRGRVYYNDDKSKVDFKIKNGGDFGAEVNLKDVWVERGNLSTAIRQIRIHICPFHTLPIGSPSPNPEDYWPIRLKNGKRWVEQPYITHIHGIRMILLPFSAPFLKEDPRKQIQVGGDVDPNQVVLDERWQNENPCYLPTGIAKLRPVFGPVEAQATLFTSDGMSEGIQEIYPALVPNEWAFTDEANSKFLKK